MLDRVCSTSTGPFSYKLMDTLCKTYGYQAVIFSGLLSAPAYIFPLDQHGEPRQDIPCLFFQEVVSLNPETLTQSHLNVIIRPEMVHKNRHICSACFQLISNGIKHRFCKRLPTCFYCHLTELLGLD